MPLQLSKPRVLVEGESGVEETCYRCKRALGTTLPVTHVPLVPGDHNKLADPEDVALLARLTATPDYDRELVAELEKRIELAPIHAACAPAGTTVAE
jgi:hypothetical protein